MPPIDLSVYANTPAADLEAKRKALIEKAAGNHDNLSLDELHELAAVTGVLRRKSSGPPKAPKAASGPRAKKEKAVPAALDDLA